MKNTVLALAFFVFLFAFAAKPSLAARHEPLVLHSDGQELLMATSNCDIVTQFECNGKSSWPELVGVNGEIAAATIQKENPNVHAIIILEGTPVTQDFRCDRVRVVVDKYEKVVQVPRIG
ncbi:hypothetical protein WN944_014362 [Citrus x changshan-huyou]|uniref:Uncharacterized protein n=2 Tax=Citrus TaxID=2706 RepID=A0A2H5N3H1_CITUN|nr:hypothetical protein CUMW_282610 [Citrus unshiu]